MSRNALFHTIPRLFTENALGDAQHVGLSQEQTHYIVHVLRLAGGDSVRLFNGRDGEWRAETLPPENMKKKQGLELNLREQLREQTADKPLILFCAPIKKTHFDFMIAKATELGVTHIQPILTARTQVRDVNPERCRAVAIEAAEQSERLSVPSIASPITLQKLTAFWPKDTLPIVCAEWGEALPAREAFLNLNLKSGLQTAIITGPEGGFAPDELPALKALPRAIPLRLGPRILRADTAALAALTCWQAFCGDWK